MERAPVCEGQGNSFVSPENCSNSGHIIPQARAMWIMKTERLTSYMPINVPYNINEHNISLGFISLSLLFSCYSWVEK